MEPKKRSLAAAERDEFLRAAWRAMVAGDVDAERLVFVDEMGANVSLCPLYAWSRRGERASGSALRATGARTSRSALQHHCGWDRSLPGGRRRHHEGGVRGLPGVGARAHPTTRTETVVMDNLLRPTRVAG